MAGAVTLNVNGKPHTLEAEPDMPLLYALRDLLGLTGTKYGCGAEQCGSCTVLVDGTRAFACAVTLAEAAGKDVLTIEGLARDDALHPLQQAFADLHAYQCGYCTSGFIMAAKALLDADPDPDEAAIRTALQDNLCRCGSHDRIVAAVTRAAREMAR